jgi:hypothetical protein
VEYEIFKNKQIFFFLKLKMETVFKIFAHSSLCKFFSRVAMKSNSAWKIVLKFKMSDFLTSLYCEVQIECWCYSRSTLELWLLDLTLYEFFDNSVISCGFSNNWIFASWTKIHFDPFKWYFNDSKDYMGGLKNITHGDFRSCMRTHAIQFHKLKNLRNNLKGY